MGTLHQFPGRVVWAICGSSSSQVEERYKEGIFEAGDTLAYVRMKDDPQLRRMLAGELVVPKMTCEGLTFLMQGDVLSEESTRLFVKVMTDAQDACDRYPGRPCLLMSKVGSHRTGEYERDNVEGRQKLAFDFESQEIFYLSPARLKVARIYEFSNPGINARFPPFQLKDISWEF
jgi:hypothetical protein